MKRLTDQRLQRLLAYVAHDDRLPAMAQQTIQADLMAIDAELAAAREELETAPAASRKGAH